ncbi:plant invertase/pectin methylesterase inhibitor protein [Medicago truncatula]|uniref:Plant invertase/pectin methylesterase inhibitor protein n=1 Tax=Medicago truncatula TaxID=3880 RepID=A0A072U969_MEDTR|nr:plant invertase/pectin methylesterase inhibitor protein [Medicago truncatula]
MKPTKLSSLFIICLCLISYVVVPTLGLKLYEEVCNDARKYSQECLDLLKGDYKIVGATNYHDLSKYILDLAIVEAQTFQDYLVGKAKQFPNDKALKKCANEFLKTTIALFESSLSKLDTNPQSSRDYAQTASIGADNCDRAIQNEKPSFDPQPIHVHNNEMFLLSVASSLSINHLT